MKRYIYNKVSLSLLSSAIFLLSSCYDLTEMSHNPYEIEGNGGTANGEVINVDDDTKYADINQDGEINVTDVMLIVSIILN